MAYHVLTLLFFPLVTLAARQPFDVRKIIQALKEPQDDLTLLCAHRGLRWNGTAENSKEAFFRASEAGLECIEADIDISADGQLPVVHHGCLGRTTDIGEFAGQTTYNPYTGKGYNPVVKDLNFTGPGGIEQLHLRDDQGRVKDEHVSTLPQMVEYIRSSGMNIVLALDFEDQNAVEPAYWALKNLTNQAGVPANEWCIYKLASAWYQTPDIFEALPWVQDAFKSGVQLAVIPVYDPRNADKFDQLASMKQFAATNYTISAQINLKSVGGPVQSLLDETKSKHSPLKTAGTFFASGDFTYPNTAAFFDTANYSLPADLHVNGSVYIFQQDKPPKLLDSLAVSVSVNGHDYRSDFSWILQQGYNWIITDTADQWHQRLQREGKRNISRMIADGHGEIDGVAKHGRPRKHARDMLRYVVDLDKLSGDTSSRVRYNVASQQHT